MKQKFLPKLLLVAILLLCSLYANAYDFVVDGMYYSYVDQSAYTCKVTYASLYATNSSTVNTTYTGSVSIPETVNYNGYDYKVVGIGYRALNNCSNMTDIMIPTTITSIDSLAFQNCSGLTEITIPRTVTSIGGYAFYNCSGIKEVEIPNGVDIIHTYTFYGCSNLEKVTIPSSVTSIWNYAFYGCSCLSDVTIPSSVTSIGNRAFRSCSKLANVTLEDGEKTLAMTTSSSYTPFNTSAIKTLYLGRNLSYNGSYSPFRGNTVLTSLTIGDEVTSISTYEFYGCTALENFEFPTSLTEIGTYAFYNCSNLSELTIPDNVTTIGSYAFYGCSGLTDISVGTGVTSIGSYAFYNCKPEEIYFYGRLSDYYLVFNGLTCGTLYAHEDQVDAIKAEYSGKVVPLEQVYTLSAEGTYPRSIALKANVNEKLLVDGVSLKSVMVGRNELSESNGLYIAKNLIPNQTYTCTLTFMYGTEERTDVLEITTENFYDEPTLQSTTPTSITYAIKLKEDAYSSLPDEYGLMYDGKYYAADEDGKATVTGLTGNTEYTFELYATYDGSTIKGESVTATTLSLTAPTVTTSSATDITATSATLNGSVTAGNEEILEQGFEYWVSEDDIQAIIATDGLSVTLPDLTPGTTYTYRAYVKTDSGTTYGETMTFTTLTIDPTVLTVSATNITDSSATLTATITPGSEEIEEQGFEYRPSSTSSSEVQTIVGDGEEMIVTLTSLSSNTTYIYCAYAKTASKTTYGEEKAFTTSIFVASTVQTNAATNITATSATLNGSYTAGSEEILKQGFEYWVSEDDIQIVIATDGLSVTLTELTPGTTYHYRAYVETNSGTTYGGTMTFTTLIINPTVQTGSATDVTFNSATLYATISAGSETIEEQGFEYRRSSASSSDVQTIKGSGEDMVVALTGLSSSTTYLYRAYAKTVSNTTYGEEKAFTTTVLVAPTVQTNAATNITSTSATLNGSFSAGTEEIEEQGFEYWATSGNDTDTHTTVADDNMSATVVGLSPSTMYLFRAYAKTASYTTYGTAMSFTTDAETVIPPTVQTFEATQITTNSAQLVGYITAGSKEILEEGFEYWISSNNKQTVTATGEYISVIVERLASNTTYTYRAYAKTESGTTYGDSMTFTTLFDADSADEDLSNGIEDAKEQLDDAWDDLMDNNPDIADEFKDEYDELMDELEDLLGQLEDAYNSGTLDDEKANEIKDKLDDIFKRIDDLIEKAKQAEANYLLYTTLAVEVNTVEVTLEETWETIHTDYPDVADNYKDDYESLKGELEALHEELDDSYNNGTLTDEEAKDIRTKLEEISQEITDLLAAAKAVHEALDGISSIFSNLGDDVQVYDLSGARVNTPTKGNVYIIRYSDGTRRKVFLK